MKGEIRVHVEMISERSPLRHWTFDHPDRVSIGYSPRASVLVYESGATSYRVLFERRGREVLLRLAPDLDGHLRVDGRNIAFGALREMALLRTDRRGDYVPLREKTAGAVRLGAAEARFWVTASPDEPEYPRHPRLLTMARETPRLFLALFLFFLAAEGIFVRFLSSLPPPPEPTIQEVANRFARILIPDERYIEREVRRRGGTGAAVPEEAAPKAASKPLPPATGFLAAVASGRAPKGASPFAGLFTTGSLGKSLDVSLASQGFDRAVAEQIRTAGGGTAALRDTPSTVSIGEVRAEAAPQAALTKSASGPSVARLSMDAPTTGGDIDRERLERLVAGRAGEVRECYERALSRSPELAGKAVFRIVLHPRGAPTVSLDPRSTLKDTALAQCVSARMAAWPFQVPERDSDPILLPFLFSPASRG
jgi:hypothetical protein